jgi:TPR repeat protein
MYNSGDGGAQDYVEAAKWYRLAAKQGVALAQHNFSIMHFQGQGVPRFDVLSSSRLQ